MSKKIIMKPMSSMEKCFIDDDINLKPEKKSFVTFEDERLSFQIGVFCKEPIGRTEPTAYVKLSGALASYSSVRQVVSVPSMFPVNDTNYDEDYIRTTPGLYPDLLRPLHYDG